MNLCRVELDWLLPRLFVEVWIPPTVEHEFNRLAAVHARFQGLMLPEWVRRSAPVPFKMKDAVHKGASTQIHSIEAASRSGRTFEPYPSHPVSDARPGPLRPGNRKSNFLTKKSWRSGQERYAQHVENAP